MEKYPLFRKNLACLKSIIDIDTSVVGINASAITLSNDRLRDIDGNLLHEPMYLYLFDSKLEIHHESASDFPKTLEVMKLFRMDSALEFFRTYKTIYTIYTIDVSFMNNIFYTLVFGLIFTTNIDDIKTYLSESIEKYALLVHMNCLPQELTINIANYFIHFLFMQCNLKNR